MVTTLSHRQLLLAFWPIGSLCTTYTAFITKWSLYRKKKKISSAAGLSLYKNSFRRIVSAKPVLNERVLSHIVQPTIVCLRALKAFGVSEAACSRPLTRSICLPRPRVPTCRSVKLSDPNPRKPNPLSASHFCLSYCRTSSALFKLLRCFNFL